MGSSADWLPIVEFLKTTHYCVLPDLPGHGGNTSRDFDRPHDLAFIAQGVKIVLDQLGLKNANVLGYSLGGRVALQLALDYPEKVNQLILENASPGIDDQDERDARVRLDQERAQAIEKDLDAFLEDWYRMPLFDSLALDPDQRAALVTNRAGNDPAWLAKLIVELSPGQVPSNWSRLNELKMPVALIGGELDIKYRSSLSSVQAAISNASLTLIPHAGHNAHLEQPDTFINTLQKILQ
jgi:2-succinyl-6-hydroxy-2,4-cyclohexadiene-1-carboxylate synthase